MMINNKLTFNIDSIEDYLDVGIDASTVMNIIETTPLEQFKPIYVTSYFLVKQATDLVSPWSGWPELS
jgi:hypothetical protein